MAVADVFDALISPRVYKAAMPAAQVRGLIAEAQRECLRLLLALGRQADVDLPGDERLVVRLALAVAGDVQRGALVCSAKGAKGALDQVLLRFAGLGCMRCSLVVRAG